MALRFRPAHKGGCASSVRVRLLGARGMTAASLNNHKDAVCTFAPLWGNGHFYL
jgi:hypothetical protein